MTMYSDTKVPNLMQFSLIFQGFLQILVSFKEFLTKILPL